MSLHKRVSALEMAPEAQTLPDIRSADVPVLIASLLAGTYIPAEPGPVSPRLARIREAINQRCDDLEGRHEHA